MAAAALSDKVLTCHANVTASDCAKSGKQAAPFCNFEQQHSIHRLQRVHFSLADHVEEGISMS